MAKPVHVKAHLKKVQSYGRTKPATSFQRTESQGSKATPYRVRARLKYAGIEFDGEISFSPSFDRSGTPESLGGTYRLDGHEAVPLQEIEHQLQSIGEAYEYEVEPDQDGKLRAIAERLAQAGVGLAVTFVGNTAKAWIVGSLAAHAPLILKVLAIVAFL